MLGELDHIDIVVDNLEASTRFFVSLGFTEIPRPNRPEGSVELRFPGSSDIVLELKASHQPNGAIWPVGLRHMALRCSNIDATFKGLSSNGVTLDAPPKFVKNSGRMLTNALGPDGQIVQIVDHPTGEESVKFG